MIDINNNTKIWLWATTTILIVTHASIQLSKIGVKSSPLEDFMSICGMVFGVMIMALIMLDMLKSKKK